MPRFGDSSFIASFYDALRLEYPRRSREQQVALQISPKGVQQGPGEMLWRFATHDRFWSIVVGEGAITLEARGYSSIDDFLTRFQRASNVAHEKLEVTERTRLGLRYINELRDPEAVTLSDWAGLLRPELLGFAASGLLEGRVEHIIQELRVERQDGTLALRHGLLTGTTVEPLPQEKPPTGRFYLIDLDYYDATECELDLSATLARMREYNHVLYRLFRWTLTDRLFDRLGPTDAV